MRYIDFKSIDPALNLASEQYVFETLAEEQDFFLLWQNSRSVIIGRNQNAWKEVNEHYAKNLGIRVIRRITGGGAVYHDLGNLNYSFISRIESGHGIRFANFCAPIIAAIKEFGVTAVLSGRNDILIDGSKISGNAQCIQNGRILHHGTILFNSDLTVMEKVLTPPEEKYYAKGVRSVHSGVNNLKTFLDAEVSLADIKSQLLHKVLLSHPVKAYVFSAIDEERIRMIAETRYNQNSWNYGSPIYSEKSVNRRIDGVGVIQININQQDLRISDIWIEGDFFSQKDVHDLENVLKGVLLNRDALYLCLQEIDVSEYIVNCSRSQLIDLIMDAVK